MVTRYLRQSNVARGRMSDVEEFQGAFPESVVGTLRDHPRWENTMSGAGTLTTKMSNDGGGLRHWFTVDNAYALTTAGLPSYRIVRPTYVFETKVRLHAPGKSSCFVGLVDASTYANGECIHNDGGVLDTVPSDAVGMLLEGEQSLNWHALAVKQDVNSALQRLSRDNAVSNQWVTLGMELRPGSPGMASVRFYVQRERRLDMKDAIRTSIPYTWALASGSRDANGKHIEYEFVCLAGPKQ